MLNGRMIPLSLSPAIGLLPARPRRRNRRGRSRWPKGLLPPRRKLYAAPVCLRSPIVATLVLALLAAANVVYQVVRKPTEMFFPVSGVLAKAPAETWAEYAPLFRAHATAA